MKLPCFRCVHSMNSLLRLCLCLVLVSLVTAGAIVYTNRSYTDGMLPGVQACQAEPLQQNDVDYTPSAIGGNEPVIQLFKADPMTLETPTSAAVYTFKVKRAKNVAISEAGTNIKSISNPSGAALSGAATGMPASAIPTDTSGKFKAVLIASNEGGTVKAELTLSFSEKLLAASGKPAGETEESDNQTERRSPKWLDQYSSPFGPPRSAMSGTEPTFFDCPSDCESCLEPEDAKSQGMGERCSPERCYYSPDNQRNWYCFKPSPGWCCADGKVNQATKDECDRMGGSWFLNQSDALDRCQPLGYCCRDGDIYQATRSDCTQAAGTYYANVVEAKERCQPIGYCCRDGDIYQATRSDCTQAAGTYYANVVEAKERCQPPCYCCAQGKVVETNQATCYQAGGDCYATLNQAYERCQQQAACWCCAQGKVFQAATQSQCAQYGGNCYASQSEALRYCQQQAACWCCAQGKVFQSTQSQCAQYGGNCYDTQAIAQRYCQQESNCWCCVNGYVKNIPQSTCIQTGGSCYSSQSQATSACRQINPKLYLK